MRIAARGLKDEVDVDLGASLCTGNCADGPIVVVDGKIYKHVDVLAAMKRSEARRKDVDYVLSFEELGAILAGRKIDVIACEPWPVERPANPTARNYPRSCGVTDAVLTEATSKIPGFKLDAKQINGIDRKTCAMVKLYAAGKMPVNFLEVMTCPGGCQNGPCSLA